MLQPARTKYRKTHKPKSFGIATRGNTVAFGVYGLKATERGKISARQIEAARRAIIRKTGRGAKLWIRIFQISQSPKNPLKSVWVVVRVAWNITLPSLNQGMFSTK